LRVRGQSHAGGARGRAPAVGIGGGGVAQGGGGARGCQGSSRWPVSGSRGHPSGAHQACMRACGGHTVSRVFAAGTPPMATTGRFWGLRASRYRVKGRAGSQFHSQALYPTHLRAARTVSRALAADTPPIATTGMPRAAAAAHTAASPSSPITPESLVEVGNTARGVQGRGLGSACS
jgi:hypothetical protein